MTHTFRTKYDFKNEFTRKKIQDAFLILSSRSALSHITIDSICSIAGIHRSTFYRHYDNIYDLLSEMERDLLRELVAVLKPFGDPWAVDENGNVKRKLLLRYFHICHWNRNLILVLTEGNVENNFRSDFVKIITDTLSPVLSDDRWTSPKLKPYMLNLTADIILSLTLLWLKKNDMDYDQFVQFYEKIFRTNFHMTSEAMELSI
ncbi:MAG: TetR/AcrR family transcriptional regulator [Firmicutes bacterium]|nr:TetR/AcrR family transcriptional regulator [Bacillota bacterium]